MSLRDVWGGLKALLVGVIAFFAAGAFAGAMLGFGSGAVGVELPRLVVLGVSLVASLLGAGWSVQEVSA
ncbi:hypothetical protein [Halobaculum sp. EA56]|uniref:hypothetical protein n=1 Tax=Halobaculum sp. EA56 TaxID=3421648 RepID=UPI003EB6C731